MNRKEEKIKKLLKQKSTAIHKYIQAEKKLKKIVEEDE